MKLETSTTQGRLKSLIAGGIESLGISIMEKTAALRNIDNRIGRGELLSKIRVVIKKYSSFTIDGDTA